MDTATRSFPKYMAVWFILKHGRLLVESELKVQKLAQAIKWQIHGNLSPKIALRLHGPMNFKTKCANLVWIGNWTKLKKKFFYRAFVWACSKNERSLCFTDLPKGQNFRASRLCEKTLLYPTRIFFKRSKEIKIELIKTKSKFFLNCPFITLKPLFALRWTARLFFQGC